MQPLCGSGRSLMLITMVAAVGAGSHAEAGDHPRVRCYCGSNFDCEDSRTTAWRQRQQQQETIRE
jgi:hypothetical protein